MCCRMRNPQNSHRFLQHSVYKALLSPGRLPFRLHGYYIGAGLDQELA